MEQTISRADEILSDACMVTLPAVYAELKAVLDDPDFCMADVVKVVSNDPAITAKLLRLANSGYFGLATKIDNVTRAVSLLGTQEVHDLVLATSVIESFSGMQNEVMDMQRFWRKSVVCAIAAKELAARCNVLDIDQVFVAGLLRDIGHLFLYQQMPKLALQAQQLFLQRGIPLYQAERSLMGVDYADLGARAMRQWNLPETLVVPTEFNAEPSLAGDAEFVTSLVHIAGVVADAFDQQLDIEEAFPRINAFAMQVTGLTENDLGTLSEGLPEKLQLVMGLLKKDG